MGKEHILTDIPDYQMFLSVDELNAALLQLKHDHPGVVQVSEAGRSRAGKPLLYATIGNGSRHALFYGCPHPNEPIGAMMSHYMARAIAEDEAYREALDFTFTIVPVVDVDGTQLNEGWFKGPFTLYHYARHFFRPMPQAQVEWTFPMDYKQYRFDSPMPETQALMRIIDETRPKFIYSLHNAGFGGAYWYMSLSQSQETYKALYAACESARVPLDLGEPEMPFAVPFAQAVYKMPYASDMYDYFEQYSSGDPAVKMSGGECSGAYAGKNTMQLVTELPYFYETRVQSQRELLYPRAEAVAQKLALQEEHLAALGSGFEAIRDGCAANNPFAQMLGYTLGYLPASIEGERAFIRGNERFKQPCTEAEAFSNLEMTRFYQLLNWGMLIRAAEWEEVRGGICDTGALANTKEQGEEILRQEAESLESALDYSVIPIRDLVAVQLASGLEILERL